MNQQRPSPFVVVVAYGDPEHLRTCLTSLAAPPQQVVVVDNALSDSTRHVAAVHGAQYLRPPRNLGFAGGVNTALRTCQVGTRDVLLLNPDAEIVWADVLRLQAFLHEQERCAAVAPRLIRPDGSNEPASWPLPSPRVVWADAFGVVDKIRAPRFLTGAVLLLHGRALAEVGEFDERFFLYAEESDWQLRALRRGWSLRVCPGVSALHVGGATSETKSGRSEHFHRSARIFARKWYGRRGAALMRAGSVVAAGRRAVTGPGPARAEGRAALRLQLKGL